MNLRHIRQAISTDSLFNVLSGWCRDGAGRRDRSICVLSAFATGGGVRALSPLIDVFLADGNKIDVVFGVDRNGTDREAVRRLSALSEAYPQQITASVFQAPSRMAIFHPKMYLYRRGDAIASAVMGSANLTLGGLAHNFESLFLYEALQRGDREVQELEAIWSTFSVPAPPLLASFWSRLTPGVAARLIQRLPPRSRLAPQERESDITELWRPLSTLPLPRSTSPIRRRRAARRSQRGRAADRFLIMDVLTETRHTQMQIPLDVVEEFFGVPRRDPALLAITISTATGLSQPIERPLVISQSADGRRLMRRLEMPTIAGLARPLAVVFVRIGNGQFAYRLLPRAGGEYTMADQVLTQHGQQGNAQRRYFIGRIGDPVWRQAGLQMSLNAL